MHLLPISSATMITYLRILRPQQWYKNIVIFLALFFSANFLNFSLLLTTTLAFCSLCLISSTNYIINDLADLKKDQLNPEKKNRPLAAGLISRQSAIILAVATGILSAVIAYSINFLFFLIVLALFFLTQLYTFILKKIVIADVLTIAILFVLRAVSGALAINVIISPWLVLCPFFLSLFLSVGKRHAELEFLKAKASWSREVLKEYNPQFTSSLMIIATVLLVVSYTFYSFLSPYNFLLYSLPFALFLMFRFYQLIATGHKIARHPENIIYDKPLLIGLILWLIVTTILIYN